MTDRLEGPAYEDLLAAAMYGHSLSEAQKLVADFAHELAEKIRAAQEKRVFDNDYPWETSAGAEFAANLIDPEVAT